ncbi:MAG: glutamate-1-semialdehyde-2,1-aminomutase [Candidatus Dadabacteria bacterium]|nr:MAG: glutamate-1-semialdehyde-2,1-aminomutase [Candidatus Dadabacteria bacterium]
MNRNPRSEQLFQSACAMFVGGVNSPVRAFGAVGGTPIFADRGEGAYLFDVDGHRYIDFVLSWGPLILGHADPVVVDEVIAVARKGTSFGMPCAAEIRLAEAIRRLFPEMEQMRLVNSGTEATMSALRLARGATGRDKIVKFAGCYHGHADALLVSAGSGLATFGQPSSPGVTAGAARDTLIAPFNDAEQLRKLFAEHGDDIAAVILETLPCNMGLILPDPEFLDAVQSLCRAHGSLLIADEVLTGCRVTMGGAYHRFGLEPDLIALGKVVGGGFPLAAYGGRREVMRHLAPEGAVYQAGTLSGNPVAATAGAVTLEQLMERNPLGEMEARAEHLCTQLRKAAEDRGIPMHAQAVGSLFGIAFTEQPPRNFDDISAADHQRYGRFFHEALARSVYLAPSGYEVGFLSTCHDDATIDAAITALSEALDATDQHAS